MLRASEPGEGGNESEWQMSGSGGKGGTVGEECAGCLGTVIG